MAPAGAIFVGGHDPDMLSERAKAEGVSLNTLALALLAEGLGRRACHA